MDRYDYRGCCDWNPAPPLRETWLPAHRRTTKNWAQKKRGHKKTGPTRGPSTEHHPPKWVTPTLAKSKGARKDTLRPAAARPSGRRRAQASAISRGSGARAQTPRGPQARLAARGPAGSGPWTSNRVTRAAHRQRQLTRLGLDEK